jgi:branched-chain amino acid transport system substrate-binding protein
LRDALESGVKDKALLSGVFSFTPQDHSGIDQRAAAVSTVKDGQFVLVQ